MGTNTMKAVVFKGPYKVEVEQRPIPTIRDPTDVIVKVIYSALCGRQVHSALRSSKILLPLTMSVLAIFTYFG